ncbi:MAG: ATP-dependent helicase, partial [Actinobacteria bacterium]|nr:ATP-dependent helicase [Actinomycetota bacterium]
MKSPSQALRTVRPHPFAASCDTLGEIRPGKQATATLLLPSLRTAPLDSPELIRITPRPAPTTTPMLSPWSVPVVWFDPASTLTVLGERADAVRYGASVEFLAEVTAFARELVARGRVLPALDHTPQGPVARWRAIVQGPDVVALHALVTAMPPVCRAEPADPVDCRGQSPSELVSDALRALVDAVMRERLAAGQAGSLLDLLPPRRGRHPKRPSAAEAWLAALSGTDGRFDAEPDDLDEVERALSTWQDFGVGQGGPARATFRLSETGRAGAADEAAHLEELDEAADSAEADTPEGGHWRLEFLLQSAEDPSLLVPAEQTWTAGESLRRWL